MRWKTRKSTPSRPRYPSCRKKCGTSPTTRSKAGIFWAERRSVNSPSIATPRARSAIAAATNTWSSRSTRASSDRCRSRVGRSFPRTTRGTRSRASKFRSISSGPGATRSCRSGSETGRSRFTSRRRGTTTIPMEHRMTPISTASAIRKSRRDCRSTTSRS
ncbi:hypothetical protein SDC9_186559 [bioreactor metagenome]|uniref:Uncharacterized protein n=1 Tax=bioreactor metagenome TaxID=1076179 RepID=A0A645HUI2_9ZZZZ